jgi:hypothetical protein
MRNGKWKGKAMKINPGIQKTVVIVGTCLLWLPVVAPVVFGFVMLVRIGRLLIDYLMPGELFPVILIAGGLLSWMAWLIKKYFKWISGSLIAAIILLVLTQWLAVVTGVASGATAMSGWQYVLVIVVYVGFLSAVISCGIGGILLWKEIFTRQVDQSA